MLTELLNELVTCPNKDSVKTLLWVLSKIDFKKLLTRVTCAYENVATKCVLLEYMYTSRAYANQGYPNAVEYMPNSRVLVHHALTKPETLQLLNKIFRTHDLNVTVYVRQKIGQDGYPDFHRKQLVVKFEPWTDVSPPASSPVMTE